jgi:vesicle-associated membrane protein 4
LFAGVVAVPEKHRAFRKQKNNKQFKMGRGDYSEVNGPSKTKAVQDEVDEVVGIMQNNIEKVVQRGEKLETLQTKTDDLQAGALQFKRGAVSARKQMWWKNMKMQLIIGGVIVLFIVIIAVSVTRR